MFVEIMTFLIIVAAGIVALLILALPLMLLTWGISVMCSVIAGLASKGDQA